MRIRSIDVSPELDTGDQRARFGIVYHKVMVTFEIEIKRHLAACNRCGVEAPPPGMSDLDTCGVNGLADTDGRYLTVGGRGFREDQYMPPGWGEIDVAPDQRTILCGACLAVVVSAARAALKMRSR